MTAGEILAAVPWIVFGIGLFAVFVLLARGR
jgi:ABC-type phosphate transport system permease subunit